MPRRSLCLGASALWLSVPRSPTAPTVTIDRIDGEVAVVEWSAGALGDVPMALLPPDTREGDRFRLKWRLVSRSPVQAPPDRHLPTAEALAPTRVQLRAPPMPKLARRRKDTLR